MTSPPDPDLRALFGEIPDPTVAARTSSSPLRVPELGRSLARALVRKRRVAALTGSAAWLLTHLAVYGSVRTDFHGRPMW